MSIKAKAIFSGGLLSALLSTFPVIAAELPESYMRVETIPGVVRDDGVDSFILEVELATSVQNIFMNSFGNHFLPAYDYLQLLDDGQGEDRVAGDNIYTAGPFTYNTEHPLRNSHYMNHDMNRAGSPEGIDWEPFADIYITDMEGDESFFAQPSAGLLRSDIPDTKILLIDNHFQITQYLTNIVHDDYTVIRGGGDKKELTQSIYQRLPDAFDFFVNFSTYQIRHEERTHSRNAIAGTHLQIQTNYSGTGMVERNNTGLYGSSGKLLSINNLDYQGRGINALNVLHEITHQWGAFLDTSPSLRQGSHWAYWSNAESLLGGFLWEENGDGSFTMRCQKDFFQAPLIEQYLMGIIPAEQVLPLYLADSEGKPGDICDQVITAPITQVTIEDIIAVNGVRTPGPATAQRDFHIGFVAQTYNRLLTPTELTFYNMLAEHFTKPIPEGEPDPEITGWPSIVRYFPGTQWRSDVVLNSTQPPTVSDITNQNLQEDEQISIAVTLADTETPVEWLRASFTSSNEALFPAGYFSENLVLQGENTERSLILTPANGISGSATITLAVEDGQQETAKTFEVTVASVNDAPDFSLSGDVEVDENFTGTQTVTVTANEVPADEQQQTVSYSLSPENIDFANVTINETDGTVSINSITGASGSQTFTVTADDGQGENNIATQTFNLVVDALNEAPAFNLSGDVNVLENFSGTQTVSITPAEVPVDEQNQNVTYSLSPGSVSFANVSINANTGQVSITGIINANGNQMFTVTADDGQDSNNTHAQTFALTVNAVNSAPVFTLSGNVSVTENFSGTQTVIITPAEVPVDEQNQTVTYSLSPSNVNFANVSINTNTGTVSITNKTDLSGSQTFTVTANDGQSENSTATQTFTLTVSAEIIPPTSSGGGGAIGILWLMLFGVMKKRVVRSE